MERRRLGRFRHVGDDPELGASLAHQFLHRPNRQPLLDDLLDHLLLQGPVGRPEQRPGMTGRDGPLRQGTLGPGRELQQPQGVGHRGPALAHPGRHLLMGQAELVDQLLVGRRLLQGVEVHPVEVLDQRLFQAGHIVGHLDQHREWSAGRPGGPPASAAPPR